MDTSYFERLPESVRKIVLDGLDSEVQSGLEHLDEVKKSGSTNPEQRAAIEGDIKRASELRRHFSQS